VGFRRTALQLGQQIYWFGICAAPQLGTNNFIEDFIEEPQPVKINKKVLSAYAASHYSLALTEDGVIYEWGMYFCHYSAKNK